MASPSPASHDVETFRLAFPAIPDPPYTKVSYGLDFPVAARKHVIDGPIQSKRPYIIASKSLAGQTDCVTRLQKALSPELSGTWVGIPAHTPWASLVPIINDMREKQADSVITLGGGSLADGAKLIVYAMANFAPSSPAQPYTIEELMAFVAEYPSARVRASLDQDAGRPPTLPIICLPTTLSGAEFSRGAGATDPASGEKLLLTHPRMYPTLLILSAELCASTPDWVWRSTGVRAIDHCVETICAGKLARRESGEACAAGLRMLVRSLLRYASEKPVAEQNEAERRQAAANRLDALLGCNASMTGPALKVWMGGSHGIGHQLGGLGVGHGVTSCVLLPAVLKFNKSVNAAQQEEVKAILWEEDVAAGLLTRRGLKREDGDAGDALRAVFDELAMQRSLKDVGIRRDQWEAIAKNSMGDLFVQMNPKKLDEPAVMEILEMCEV